jgi:hypothetical protein
MRLMPETPVVIVGGGASGLSAAGALARRGIESVVLERDAAIGGSWARRYERLHLHTMRMFSGLAGLPIPRRYPTYLSRDQVVSYLNEYAQRLRLKVVTGTAARRIRRDQSIDRWIVETASREAWQSPVVVVATGQYQKPVVPPWPGRERYGGRFLHSVEYSNATPYVGQRVLVVGIGNSGAEIATDLAENGAAAVAISVRTVPAIVPRDPFGMPVQRTSILLSMLPAAIADRVGYVTARVTIGDLSRYGLRAARFAPYSNRRIPLIDVGFVKMVKAGRITVRPALERLTATDAVFADGSSEPFAAVIAATGFTTGLESLLDVPDALDAGAEPRGVSGEPTGHPGLYFVGYVHSLRGHLFEANRASRRLARHVARYLDR